MSLNRYAQRRDANETPLVEAARRLGVVMLKAGPLDWWAGWRQCWYPVEIKMPKGKYTPAQVEFIAECEARQLPVWTWRAMDDVLGSLAYSSVDTPRQLVEKY